MRVGAYCRLMRFDKPVGIVLLWFPVAWALWLANRGMPSILLLCYFIAGTLIMRAAGCVINDIADRNIDKYVKRTALRPLALGELTVREALMVFILLCGMACLIALQLPRACFYYALAALMMTMIYPFCKRWIQMPQVVLGLAFSFGIPMAYSASGVSFDAAMWALVFMNMAWVVAYDTMYAMVDREDDLQIGVKSTAVLFADYDRIIILVLQLCFHALWCALAFKYHFSSFFWLFWLIAGLVLVQQQTLIYARAPAGCFKAFLTNIWYGGLMWLGLMMA